MPPDPVPPEGQPEGETLVRFAVVLAAHRGQLAALDDKVTRLAQTVQALAEGGPKGPPMIAWHDLDPDEAAAARADLATWVDQVLFPLYPSARESVRECWHQHPDAVTELSACWLEFRRIFAPATPAQLGKRAVRRPSLADTLVYLDRWLPGTLRRVKLITERCTGIDGHVPGLRRAAQQAAAQRARMATFCFQM
jgi:hypothetical protein